MSLEEMESVSLRGQAGTPAVPGRGGSITSASAASGDSRNLEHMPIRLRPFPI
jgi:hypothetical protein